MKLTELKSEQYFKIVTGIIIALVIFLALGAFRSSARDEQRFSNLKEIQGSLHLYYLKFQVYPIELGELEKAGIGLRSVPKDPRGSDYTYAASDDHQYYVLMATFQDYANYHLKDDIDGLVNGINCDDRPSYNYCVGNL